MSPGTERQGANYQPVSLIQLCSLVLFMCTEAYLRSVSEPLALVPDIRDQQIQNIFRPAHFLSLYQHLKPEQNASFQRAYLSHFERTPQRQLQCSQGEAVDGTSAHSMPLYIANAQFKENRNVALIAAYLLFSVLSPRKKPFNEAFGGEKL